MTQPHADTALVWFKRDLRLHDHAPLAEAAGCRAALGLVILEPEWLESPEFDPAHLAWWLACVAELRAALLARGLPLLLRHGRAVDVLAALRRDFPFERLLSHEETGPGWTYQRDLAVGAWCREQGVVWRETPQHGVIRRLKSRSGWAGRWQARMDAAAIAVPAGFAAPESPVIEIGRLPTPKGLGLAPHGKTLQAAGEAAGLQTLQSFLTERSGDYRRALSSPLSAEDGCSRLSPHLAWGTVSLRRVHQATEAQIAAARAAVEAGDPAERAAHGQHAHALRGFAGRLRWHCHFMQKLEDEPQIEFRNFARVCDGLREGDFDPLRFAAWREGQTGFPMVDACMRSLRATGWLNFRMRAMLVSFAAYHLWLHWREPGQFLARQFLDFEAGIHWSQMQMQSGTTGINTLRMYSPTKQAADQDPQGVFIRRWCPELARVPLPYLAQPWTLPATLQQHCGTVIGRDYPAPIVDEVAALRLAKDRCYGLRATAEAWREADQVQQRHGSRRSGLPDTTGAARRAAAAPPIKVSRPARRAPALPDAVQPDLFGSDETP
jgi:deoxyribodipyrimidine photo-lyase